MPVSIQLLAWSAVLTWLMIFSAAMARARAWTPDGLKRAFGNRDEALPDPSPAVARADRAAKNMSENLPLFIAVVVAAYLAGRGGTDRVELGAHLFFWGRVGYLPIYVVGIRYVRTLLWWTAVVGIGLVASAVILPP
jgi:uncharacterized MAPEG superfamily protein